MVGRSGDAIRRGVFVAAQVGISAGALAYVLYGMDLAETRHALGSANYAWLPLAALLLLADLGLRAVRWRLLLASERRLRLSHLFGASNVGYLVNNILPLRLGEVARVLVVDEVERTGKIRAAASVAVERGIDLIAMVCLVMLLLPFVDEPSWARGPVIVLGALLLAGFCIIAVLARAHASADAFWRRWLRRTPAVGARAEALVGQVLEGFEPLLRPQVFVPVAALTAVIWACAALSFFMVMRAFSLPGGFAAAALVLGATTLGMVVPSSPGYVGVFHAIAVTTLTEVFGVPHAEALSYAFAQHALIVLLPSACGVIFLLQRRELVERLTASLRGAPGWARMPRGGASDPAVEAGRVES